uniref:Uncharacterized protein n=2 Tax=Zea mays TaxID=4577 RepID=A0A804R684_MAIZE
MNMGGVSPSTVRCKHCSTQLTVCPGERAIQCTQCCGVTRIRRRRVQRPAAAPPTTGFPRARGKKRALLIGITYAAGLRPAEGGPQRRQVHEATPLPALRLPQRLHHHAHWYAWWCDFMESVVFCYGNMGWSLAGRALAVQMTRRTRSGCPPRTTSGWGCSGWWRGAARATPSCSTSPAWARRSPTTTATSWTGTTRPSARWTRSRRDPSWTTRSTRLWSARWSTASSCTPSSTPATAPPSSTSRSAATCPEAGAGSGRTRAPRPAPTGARAAARRCSSAATVTAKPSPAWPVRRNRRPARPWGP